METVMAGGGGGCVGGGGVDEPPHPKLLEAKASPTRNPASVKRLFEFMAIKVLIGKPTPMFLASTPETFPAEWAVGVSTPP